MSEIKRYETSWFMGDEPSGNWVQYDDHLAAVEAAVMAERDEIVKSLNLLERKHGDSPYTPVTEGRMWGVMEAIEAIRARTTQPAKEAG